jgi:hypothetical protein
MPYRRRGERPYRWGPTYVTPGWTGWINPYPWGYPYDWNDDSDSQDAPPYNTQADSGNAAQGYDDQGYGPPYADQLPPYPSLGSRSSYAPAGQSPAPEASEAVTLIFNDGSPSEQIHNYILTATSLYVLDSGRRTISTRRIDLAATARVNHDAGVEFHLPEVSQ